MRHYLATTGISEIWDLDKEVVLLGPWCLTSENNRRSPGMTQYSSIPSPWDDSTKKCEASQYCFELYGKIVPELSSALNSIHNVSYPVAYWQVLLGPWLLRFISVLYDKYIRIEHALKAFPDFSTHVIPRERCNLVSFDSYDFLPHKVNEDHYNLALCSVILYDLCPDNIVIKEYEYKAKAQVHIVKYGWKNRLFKTLMSSLGVFYKSPFLLCDMFHLVPSDVFLLKLKGLLKVFHYGSFEPLQKNNFLKHDHSNKNRDLIRLNRDGDRFQSLLCRMLPDAIPMSYVEHYDVYKDSVRNIKNKDSVKIIGSTTGWYSNERLKFFAAERMLSNAKLVYFQHGGGHGMLKSVLNEAIHLEKDIFYTWGWSREKYSSVKPLPNPHLSRLRDAHSPRVDRILFAGTSMPRYNYQFDTALMSDDMPKYLEDKKIFFMNLGDKEKNKILYRPYPFKYEWKEEELIRKISPNTRFALKGSLVSWMKKARLVVIDNPHTSFIEALAINVPSVFYWDHGVFLMKDEAEPYFDILREAGILYRDPVDAANKVTEVFKNTSEWWHTEKIQKARCIFLERFGYSRKDWMSHWIKEMKEAVKQ